MGASPPAARRRHEGVPALKGWANIGRRFATTGSWPVTTFVTENILQGQEDQVSKEKGGQDSFIENGTDS
jgi:hypothetical protein